MNFDEYLEEALASDDELRKEYELLKAKCSGCVYENEDGSTEAVSNCVCCSRQVDFAKHDNYKRK